VLRAKINMESKNGCMRDPSLYRVVMTPPHHRTGTKYKVYPTYDLACPIVDSLEHVTHALRSNEYHDRNEQYEWILKATGVTHVRIADYSRLNFGYTVLSKRKLQWFVDSNIVEGWDSPAFPTVRGMLRRGLTVPALKAYIYAQGSSMRGTNQGMEKLWSINKQLIDRVVPRYWAIPVNARVKLTLTNGPEGMEYRGIPFHKQNLELGNKVTHYSSNLWIEEEDAKVVKLGEEITLMDWGNCYIKEIKKEADKIVELVGELHLAGDYKTTTWKWTWLSADSVLDLVPVELIEYDFLITKSKIEKDDKLSDYVHPKMKVCTEALGDPNLRLLSKGAKIQLERRGYWICDKPYFNSDKLVLINIPDGKKDTPSHLTAAVKKPVQEEKVGGKKKGKVGK